MPTGYPKDPEAYRARQAAAKEARAYAKNHIDKPSEQSDDDVVDDFANATFPDATVVRTHRRKSSGTQQKRLGRPPSKVISDIAALNTELNHATRRIREVEAENLAYKQTLADERVVRESLAERYDDMARKFVILDRRFDAVLDLIVKVNNVDDEG